MGTNRYLDPSIPWVSTQDGLGTGTAYGSFAGMKTALATVVAGDTVYMRGGTFAAPKVINHILYVTATTTSDHSPGTGTWVVGDTVRNFTGSGDDWTGTIYSIAAKVVGISISTGDYSTVATADKVENVTRSENDTFTKAAAASLAITTAGTAAALIRWIDRKSVV